MDIDSDSSMKGDESLHRDFSKELKLYWSKDSTAESDIVFASRSPVGDGSHRHWPEFRSGLRTLLPRLLSTVSQRSQDVGVTADSCDSLASVFFHWVSTLSTCNFKWR